jgi:DNA-directed RNA polymerase sigma subunit (sigma70/sigma32)
MVTTKWAKVKNDPVKYAALKRQVVESRRRKAIAQNQSVNEIRRQNFLDSIGGDWESAKHLISPIHRQVLELHFGLDGDEFLSLTEIGLRLGKSKQAISGLKTRAIKLLLSACLSN